MNPLFSALKTTNKLGNTTNMFNSIKNGNPMQMLGNLAMSNPQARNLLTMLSNGANPQQLFYQECQRRGINPQDILNQMK